MEFPEISQVDDKHPQDHDEPSPPSSGQLSSSVSQTSTAIGSSDPFLRTPECSQSHSGNTQATNHHGCSSDKDAFKTVKVHTAKCSECDQRNMDTMLRCPGCTFQVCKPCRDKRDRKGKGLAHGVMASPGGLFRSGGLLGRSGGLGSGSQSVTRKRLPGLNGSMSPSPAPSFRLSAKATTGDVYEAGAEDVIKEPAEQDTEQHKLASAPVAKSASKKRPAKPRPRPTSDEESSGDDFRPDAMSPTPSKRRRTALSLTDTPTATSARPSRKTSGPSAYIVPSSPSSDSALDADISSVRQPPPRRAVVPKDGNVARSAVPKDRIQELLEEHGVNTADNPYDEHFLGRRVPVVTNPVIRMPPGMGEMEEPKE